ncbi:transmembrane protein 200C-like [Seriola dumerili]|uniref:transmembrane protein 200C-like n=1 Tax=Seriola dumerili TaxID=41447 RepID=UPI000BBEE616|nr:transmembrane protein 200C-like [Seriola dumerili]
MIATGGLLRINARRQDSLRSKPQKPHTHKKKSKKRRSEVVVVKGKLKLCSVSGLVAALGILVLLVGVVMAALGYWPRDGLFFRSQPQEGAAMASVSSISSTPAPAGTQGGERGEERQGEEGDDKTLNETTRRPSRGFLEDFLDRYLYSDRLKVFGPLIMGIGIFLFICANAVLHENRDKKTKVINLRDIYSTVIDLHSLRRPNSSTSCSARRSSTNPLNGLVNYIQSKSLESKPRTVPPPELQPTPPLHLLDLPAEGGAQLIHLTPAPPPPSCPPQEALSSSWDGPELEGRRRSLPTGSVITGYSKLTHGEDESFESTEITSSHVTSQASRLRSEEVTSQRKYSNREKLRIISQVDSGLRQEEEG